MSLVGAKLSYFRKARKTKGFCPGLPPIHWQARLAPAVAFFSVSLTAAQTLLAQANLPIYTDQILNGFQDWSWASHDLSNTAPVHSGAASVRVSSEAWQALSFAHTEFSTTPYTNLSFWAHGGSSGGQELDVYVQYDTDTGPNRRDETGPMIVLTNALLKGAWQKYVIPLSTLGVAQTPSVNTIVIRLTDKGTTNTFYLDDVQLDAAPAPALTHLTIDATNTLRTADARWFGLNTGIWDEWFDTPQTWAQLRELGCCALRFPFGSLSDQYHWASNYVVGSSWQGWPTTFSKFVHVATNLGAQAYINVNYGTGTSEEAAAWVLCANVTNHCGFKYWEIGNESYGSWEIDSNTPPHDPHTYAVRAAGYIARMKAADPTIKLGVPAVPGEDSWSNNEAHPAINLLTGEVHYGWTPVMLATFRALGVTPDFLVHHVYPESMDDSDPLLLQSTVNWAKDAADLRQQIRNYFGSGGDSIELDCTENNADGGSPGRQSTSIVNALYLADSLAQLMKTEFNSFFWCDLRNGPATTGSFDPGLYGWRTNGDLGIILGSNTLYPTFYALKLMQYLAQPGDTVLDAASDNPLLSVYAARQASGALTVLVINKDLTTSFNAQLRLTNFVPCSTALVRSYGIAQDEAVRTNNPAPGAQDIATNSASVSLTLRRSFPPGSLTLFTFPPAAPELQLLRTPASQIIFQLRGQPKVRYVIQTSPDLKNWSAFSTNILTGNTLNFSSTITGGCRFWRVVWEPFP